MIKYFLLLPLSLTADTIRVMTRVPQVRIFPLLTIFYLPLLLSADTIKVKTRAPQNQSAVFQYRVPRGYNPKKTCRVLVIFGGRNTDGKADAAGRMG